MTTTLYDVDGKARFVSVIDDADDDAATTKTKWSRSPAFPVADNSKAYFLNGIPAGLWRAVAAKCRREGLSRRALLLQLLTDWIADDAVAPKTEPSMRGSMTTIDATKGGAR
jgi:hypothetical protein